jgi:hypothetical protein
VLYQEGDDDDEYDKAPVDPPAEYPTPVVPESNKPDALAHIPPAPALARRQNPPSLVVPKVP